MKNPSVKPIFFFIPVFLLLFMTFLFQNFTAPQTAYGDIQLTPTLPATSTATATFDNFYSLPVILRELVPTPTSTPTSSPTCTPPATIDPIDTALETETYNQISQQRANNGLTAISSDDRLVQAARRHAIDMATNNLTSHTGSDGSTAAQRILESCYPASATNEIIAFGFGGDPAQAVDWWMNSPTHRSIVLTTGMDHMGVGYAYNASSDFGHYWAVTFAKLATTSSSQEGPTYTCHYSAVSDIGGSSIIYTSDQPCPDITESVSP